MNFTGAGHARTPNAFARAAKTIGCDTASVKAVVQVEAAGSGYDKQGRPKMLFEPHIFYRLLKGDKRSRAIAAGLAYAKWKPGAYPKESYTRLGKAMAIDETAALKACSWGLPQILGENHHAAGYETVQDMVEDFLEGEDNQIAAMAKFIVANGMHKALKARNWAEFARRYNGPGYKKHAYDVKLEQAYRKIKAADRPMTLFSEAEEADEAQGTERGSLAEVEEVDEPEISIEPDDTARGDREVYWVQKRLKAMNYSPGRLDGDWGGGTAGAITAFLNDRGGHIPAPASHDAFNEVRAALKAEIVKAETEGFKRPVSEERAKADPKVVAEVAPEVVPQKQNFFVALWGSICTAVVGVYNSISDTVKSTWDFFMDHKDDLPETDSGFISTLWSYATSVPPIVWFVLLASGLAYIAINARRGVAQTTEAVQKGVRQ